MKRFMKLALCLAFWTVGGIGLMAQNPIIRNQFSADPSALVVGDKVYVFPSHDIPAPDDYGRKDWFCMADYHVFSSENLTDWTDHGKIVDQNEVEWVNSKSYSMWAPDCKPHNGKYYFYFPALMKVTEGMRFGGYRVGVATADKPEGPYTVMPKPIEGVGGIDPCIFVDDDGSGYLVWPSRGFVICKLNDDWTSLSDQRHTVEGVPTKGLTEGPYLFKRGEYYYMTFPWARENTEVLAYCMAKNIFGPYEFKGVFFEEHANGCWTNHHSIINFKDQWYIFYHCNHYSPSFDKNRAVCADSLFFNEDGTIKMVKPTLRGIGVAKADALLEIDRYSTISGDAYIDYHDTLNCFMGWKTIFPKKGGKVTFNTVDFSGKKKGYVQVRVRAPQGGTLAIGAPKVFATVQVPQTQDWKVVTAKVSKFPKGIQNLEVTLTGGSDVEVDWVTFNNPPFSEGGMKTGKYRNYFAEMGFSQKEIDAKLKSVFNDVFYGPHKCYFEVGDSLGYISDVKNHDVRTEGMSYGMMIAVQFGNKDIFDRLWRWSKKYMQMTEGPGKGYFAWSCKTDGTRNANGPASDGELYYITSLIFASNLWGNNTGINYLAEAQYIINESFNKKGVRGSGALIDPETQLITFVPGANYTDPSYHLPAFYEVWAKWLNDGRSEYWMQCAEKSREYLHKSINPANGLNPDTNNYDGSQSRGFFGSPGFRFDSWRVPMNIALDYSWSCADKDWQQNYGNTFQSFLYFQGVDKFVDQYNFDGTLPTRPMRAGNFPPALRHCIGLVATSAAASLVCNHGKSREFVQQLWDSKLEPLPDGFFDEYYDSLLRLFAFMHLSGNYRVIGK